VTAHMLCPLEGKSWGSTRPAVEMVDCRSNAKGGVDSGAADQQGRLVLYHSYVAARSLP